jgi:hypothetical protein
MRTILLNVRALRHSRVEEEKDSIDFVKVTTHATVHQGYFWEYIGIWEGFHWNPFQ